MPSRGTPQHSIRIPAVLWDAAQKKAATEQPPRNVSDVIRELLAEWIREGNEG